MPIADRPGENRQQPQAGAVSQNAGLHIQEQMPIIMNLHVGRLNAQIISGSLLDPRRHQRKAANPRGPSSHPIRRATKGKIHPALLLHFKPLAPRQKQNAPLCQPDLFSIDTFIDTIHGLYMHDIVNNYLHPSHPAMDGAPSPRIPAGASLRLFHTNVPHHHPINPRVQQLQKPQALTPRPSHYSYSSHSSHYSHFTRALRLACATTATTAETAETPLT